MLKPGVDRLLSVAVGVVARPCVPRPRKGRIVDLKDATERVVPKLEIAFGIIERGDCSCVVDPADLAGCFIGVVRLRMLRAGASHRTDVQCRCGHAISTLFDPAHSVVVDRASAEISVAVLFENSVELDGRCAGSGRFRQREMVEYRRSVGVVSADRSTDAISLHEAGEGLGVADQSRARSFCTFDGQALSSRSCGGVVIDQRCDEARRRLGDLLPDSSESVEDSGTPDCIGVSRLRLWIVIACDDRRTGQIIVIRSCRSEPFRFTLYEGLDGATKNVEGDLCTRFVRVARPEFDDFAGSGIGREGRGPARRVHCSDSYAMRVLAQIGTPAGVFASCVISVVTKICPLIAR